MIAGGNQHAFDLVIFSLLQHDFQLVRSQHAAGDRRQWSRLVVQLHAGQQLRYQFGRDRIMRGGFINLGDVPLGRRLLVDERTVIRHQQQAGGVVIEPPHRLHIAPRELFGQQGQDAGVVAGFSGTFEVGRLVQRDVHMFTVNPLIAEYPEHETAGFDSDPAISDGLSGDAHFTGGDQFTAPFSRTKALRLQDAVQSQFAHGRTVAEAARG